MELVLVSQVISHLAEIDKPISRGELARLRRLPDEAKVKWAKNIMQRYKFTLADVHHGIAQRQHQLEEKDMRSIAHDIREGMLHGDFFGKSLWLTYQRSGYEAAQEYYQWLRAEKGPAATIHALAELDERWADFNRWYKEHTACRNR